MNLRNRANCNTSNTNANELCFFSVTCGTSLSLGIVWVQISRAFKAIGSKRIKVKLMLIARVACLEILTVMPGKRFVRPILLK